MPGNSFEAATGTYGNGPDDGAGEGYSNSGNVPLEETEKSKKRFWDSIPWYVKGLGVLLCLGAIVVIVWLVYPSMFSSSKDTFVAGSDDKGEPEPSQAMYEKPHSHSDRMLTTLGDDKLTDRHREWASDTLKYNGSVRSSAFDSQIEESLGKNFHGIFPRALPPIDESRLKSIPDGLPYPYVSTH